MQDKNPLPRTKFYNFLTLAFIFFLLISNIAEIKIINLFNLVQIGAGTIFFPSLYILNDIITEVYGLVASRRSIYLALITNITFIVLMQLVLVLPNGKDWQEYDAFDRIFSLSPKITIASLSSYFLGELSNSYILSALKIKFQGRIFAVRAIFSTLVSSSFESIIFGIIVFYKRIPNDELIKMSLTLIIIKVLYEITTLPLLQVFIKYLKDSEYKNIETRSHSLPMKDI